MVRRMEMRIDKVPEHNYHVRISFCMSSRRSEQFAHVIRQ